MSARLKFIPLMILLSAVWSFGQTQPPQKLTVREAERIALQNHPQIRSAEFRALAAQENVREARASYYPFLFGSLTGAEADHNSRIAAGGLNNPIIYNRYSNGITVGQLIADFGRTKNLVATSKLNAQAEGQSTTSRREEILLQVDEAYYATLRAQAILKVAQETVSARQLLLDQVTALAQSNLKSSLDVSFAAVNLGEAKLLLVRAQNDLQSSFMSLSTALGDAQPQTFELSEEPLPAAPPDYSQVAADALKNRPDLQAQQSREEAAERFVQAERDLKFPTVNLLGTAGLTPVGQSALADRYAAVGINMNIPLFNGHLFSAREAEAKLQDQAATQDVRDLQNRIARDVRIAWLNANTAYNRLDLTAQLLQHASESLDLAQARYNLGLSSIVELSQAQLNKTTAEIEQASANYDYQSSLAFLGFQTGALH